MLTKRSWVVIFIAGEYKLSSNNLEDIKKELESIYPINKNSMQDTNIRSRFKNNLVQYLDKISKDNKIEIFEPIEKVSKLIV